MQDRRNNMRFRKLREAIFRRRLKKQKFYQGITFESIYIKKNAERVIASWIFNLKESKQIKVRKFKDLFENLKEVAFPITIKFCNEMDILHINFVDREGKEYYMMKMDIHKRIELENYMIGRRNSILEPWIDRVFTFEICKDEFALLLETSATSLNRDGTNQDKNVKFVYNNPRVEAMLTLPDISAKIRIIYYNYLNEPEIDRSILKFLLYSDERIWNYYDAVPILKWIVKLIPERNISVSIVAEVEETTLSAVEVVRGTVISHIFTTIVNESEMQVNKRLIKEELNQFLLKLI